MILYEYISPERTGFFSSNSSNTLKRKDSKELNDEEYLSGFFPNFELVAISI